LRLNAEIVFFNQLRLESGVRGKLRDDLLALFRRQIAALSKGLSVVIGAPLLHFLDGAIEIGGEFRHELFVVCGNHGVAGHDDLIGQIIQVAGHQGLEIEPDRKQGNAVDGDIAVDQMIGERRCAGGAVALTKQKQRRAPALVAREVETDKAIESVSITIDVVELFGQVRTNAAVAGAGSVNEDEIRAVKNGFGIVNYGVWRSGHSAVAFHLDLSGTERTHVQPGCRGSGAAVEDKGKRAGVRIFAVERVGGKKDGCLGWTGFGFQDEASCSGGVLEQLSGDGDLVVRDYGRGFRESLIWRGCG